MNLADLQATVTTIKEQGPNRVLINRDGEAVRPSKFAGFVDFILIRDDGWSLACRRDLLDVAFRLWHDHWIAFMPGFNSDAKPISELPL